MDSLLYEMRQPEYAWFSLELQNIATTLGLLAKKTAETSAKTRWIYRVISTLSADLKKTIA